MTDNSAGGAAKARNKLATYLTENGVHISYSYPGPPTDLDFLVSIQKFAEGYGKRGRTLVIPPSTDRFKQRPTRNQSRKAR